MNIIQSLSLEEINCIGGGGKRLKNFGKCMIGGAIGLGVTMATMPCLGLICSNILGAVFQISVAVQYTGIIIPPEPPRRTKHKTS